MTRRASGIAGPGGRVNASGFTLIELLVATALLAVLALLSWRGLDAVLESRRRIVAASDELRALTVAFSQLDEDLRRSWPVRLLRLPAPSIGFSVSGEQARATLELLRETTTGSEATQLQRVAWRLRDGVLERGFGRWRPPSAGAVAEAGQPGEGSGVGPAGAPGSGSGAPAAWTWQPVLGGITEVQWQGWIVGQGWVAGEALAGQLRGPGDPANPGAGQGAPVPAAVTGLLIRVVRADGRVLQRVFPVKD
jgi:general secretion pathway protein J